MKRLLLFVIRLSAFAAVVAALIAFAVLFMQMTTLATQTAELTTRVQKLEAANSARRASDPTKTPTPTPPPTDTPAPDPTETPTPTPTDTPTPSPTSTLTPTPTDTPTQETGNCSSDPLGCYDTNRNGRITCAEAREHGIAPVPRGHPAYQHMRDGDNDGVVCE